MRAYKKKEIAEMLWKGERGIEKNKEVLVIEIWSARSKKRVKRYLFTKEINEELIKKAIKEQTW